MHRKCCQLAQLDEIPGKLTFLVVVKVEEVKHRRMLAWGIQLIVDTVCKGSRCYINIKLGGADNGEVQATEKKQKRCTLR